MDSYMRALKQQGFKITPRRKAIIDIFLECHGHLTPEDVWERLRVHFSHCGLPSVYRNLESLVECGILVRIQQFDRKKHYALLQGDPGGHHHQITCVNCGRVDEMDRCFFSQHRNIKGYKVISHFFQVNGVCPECSGSDRQ
jgi:Fur family transcriptional regulator, ferric uptake regulator